MLNDESMILKIGNYNFGEWLDFVAKEVHYHHQSKRKYLHKKDKSSKKKPNNFRQICRLFESCQQNTTASTETFTEN